MRDLIGQEFGRLLVQEKTRQDGMVAWLCKCKCGNEKIAKTNHLTQGKTKSCGCFALEIRTKPPGHASMTKVIYGIKRNAKDRNLEFSLSDEEIKDIITKNCHYCGAEPKEKKPSCKRRHTNGNVFVNGIDRMDSSKGYTKENCITCCWVCNRMKSDLSYDDFIRQIKLILGNINP